MSQTKANPEVEEIIDTKQTAIIILPEDHSRVFNEDFLPEIDDHTLLIIYSPGSKPKSKPYIGYIVVEAGILWDGLNTGKSLIDESTNLLAKGYDRVSKNWSGGYVLNLRPGFPIRIAIDTIYTRLSKYIGKNKAKNIEIYEFFRRILEDEKFMAIILKDDGELVDLTEYHTDTRVYIGDDGNYENRRKRTRGDYEKKKDENETEETKSETAKTVDWKSKDPNLIMDLVESVIRDIQYDGFSPDLGRKVFIDKFKDDISVVKNLMLVFSAYSHSGNNVKKLTAKRMNTETGRKLMNLCNTLGIIKKASSKRDITLPRIAISFMPEYLVFRKYLGDKLQNQTSSSIDVRYKDIVFSGCPAISKMSGYEDFHKEFSSYIHEKGKKTKIDDKDFLSKLSTFKDVAESGFDSDGDIHDKMKEAIAKNSYSKSEAFEFMLDSVSEFRKNYEVKISVD